MSKEDIITVNGIVTELLPNTIFKVKLTDMEDKIKLLQDKGFSAKDISVILSGLYGINKNKIYKASVNK